LNDSLIQIGVDCRDNLYYAARLNYSGGRPDVKALLRLDKENLKNHHLLKGDNLIFSINDDKVTFKKIQIDKNDEMLNEKVNFELAQSMLDDESNFIFDHIESYDTNKIIGMVVNRSGIEKIISDHSFAKTAKVGFLARSLGLAKGYMTFCRQTGGELIALLDFNAPIVSIAFIYKNKIIDLAHVKMDNQNIDDESRLNQLAVEIKTMLNFKQASFSDEGVSIPLSAIVVSGYDFDDPMFKKFKDSFNLPLSHPEINPAYFDRNRDTQQIPLEKYLVALGLAVK
jgi:hypothetical protein